MGSSIHTYHHGNLQTALLAAAIAEARAKGPASLTLRALARNTGVTPTSVYRHFKSQQAFLIAVKATIAAMLANTMRAQLAQASQAADPFERLRIICRAYIQFARAESGLFQTACDPTITEALAAEAQQATHNEPFQILQQIVEDIARTGLIPPNEDTLQLSIIVWATSHGLAVLLANGQLSMLSEAEQEQVITKALNTVTAGMKKV
jgi:AcrR family transcriptional regulator